VKLGRVLRGGMEDYEFVGALCATDIDGNVLGSAGKAEHRAFIRSAAKPIQALPLALAADDVSLDIPIRLLALACASHAGRPEHVDGVHELLALGDLHTEDLQCGVHQPFDLESRDRLRELGKVPTALHNNCSGKHAGMLLACRLLDLPIDNYLALDHPLQQLIFNHFLEVGDFTEDQVGVAVDGCGVPCYRIPLRAAACIYARLANHSWSTLAPGRVQALAKLSEAMLLHPEMVAGPGRFTTELMLASEGRILAKEGAAGFYSIGVKSDDAGSGAMGLALKVTPGSEEIRAAVVVEVLAQLGCLTGSERQRLSAFDCAPVRNHAGTVVGSVEVDLQLVT